MTQTGFEPTFTQSQGGHSITGSLSWRIMINHIDLLQLISLKVTGWISLQLLRPSFCLQAGCQTD